MPASPESFPGPAADAFSDDPQADPLIPTPPALETRPRAALVTGAARRLGRAAALELAALGYDVAVHHRDSPDEARETAALIQALGRRAVLVQGDLSREEEVDALAQAALAALGPLGVLVNNASVFELDMWDSATRESWDAHMETNLRAPFVLSQAMARALPPSATGVIINLLDQRVWNLTPYFISYTLSKAGLWTLTQTLALALAPRVRVVGIGPGPALPSPRQTPQQFAAQAASVPLGHGTSPEEIARAVRFVLEAPSLTGQMIALDGGQHLGWAQAGPVRRLDE
ncbi:SDR family oxidoreductase [Pararhodospirillum oryzae]|uniref:Short chain dehydrogenase n=1 Tax=Pararhodospirillum oryzae TaxID=478448 RepID=A0A512H5B4_9PROT|nr:SDR family oxidoreductase [Pararhodospirillum oryzae]GEO80627.1 short chain dehydrogenase [Pararhodospirillum oryzae]